MRAYNLAMVIIFINCGFAIVAAMEVFGNPLESHSTNVVTLFEIVTTAHFTIPLINVDVTAITILAGAMVLGSILVFNTTAGPQASGWAIGAFAIVFWGGLVNTYTILTGFPFPGVEIFYTIFVMAATLIFIMALIQMPTGGQKAHV